MYCHLKLTIKANKKITQSASNSISSCCLMQEEEEWLGLCNSLSVGAVCLLTSRIVDIFYGKLKTVLLILMTVCSVSYIWFMLLSLEIIQVTKGNLLYI